VVTILKGLVSRVLLLGENLLAASIAVVKVGRIERLALDAGPAQRVLLEFPTVVERRAAGPSAGTFKIIFQDGDEIGFEVPLGSTHSTAHALGGTPGVNRVLSVGVRELA
jgi:hypothetical protein